MGGWVGGWIIWKYNQLSHQLGWIEAWAELSKNNVTFILSYIGSILSILDSIAAQVAMSVLMYGWKILF